jgi:hypothetical protein
VNEFLRRRNLKDSEAKKELKRKERVSRRRKQRKLNPVLSQTKQRGREKGIYFRSKGI